MTAVQLTEFSHQVVRSVVRWHVVDLIQSHSGQGRKEGRGGGVSVPLESHRWLRECSGREWWSELQDVISSPFHYFGLDLPLFVRATSGEVCVFGSACV